MILDERTEFLDAFTIPAAGTAIVGDVIDTGIARDLGNGRDIWWYVSADVAGAGGTSIAVNLVTDDNAALATPTVIASSGTIALASMTPAGKMLYMIPLPVEGVPYERYLGIQLVTTGVFSAGAISSGLTLDPKGWKAYPDAVN